MGIAAGCPNAWQRLHVHPARATFPRLVHVQGWADLRHAEVSALEVSVLGDARSAGAAGSPPPGWPAPASLH